MLRQVYTVTIVQENNYVSVRALYQGPADVEQLIKHKYSDAIDAVVDALFQSGYSIKNLTRRTVDVVRAHEYDLHDKLWESK